MNISVGETVRKAEALGEEQYKKFVEERLVKCEKPITDILSKNKLPLFSRPSVKCPSRQKMQIATLKGGVVCVFFFRWFWKKNHN